MRADLPCGDLDPNCNRTLKLLNEMANVDLAEFGISEKTQIFESGIVCVDEEMRQLKLGSDLIKRSIDVAKEQGAEYYFVHAVSRIIGYTSTVFLF